MCSPLVRASSVETAMRDIPWSLILFLAATLALGSALVESGAATWMADAGLDRLSHLPTPVTVVGVVVVSLLAHLIVGSRSARSSVLIPLVLPVALAAGVDLTLLAFASTVAAGYCITLPPARSPLRCSAARCPTARSRAHRPRSPGSRRSCCPCTPSCSPCSPS